MNHIKIVLHFYLMLLLSLVSVHLMAHPTSYEGGYALMSEMDDLGSEVSIIYSPKYWLGVGVVGIRSKDQYNLLALQLGLLVKRWNMPGAQGNFYLIGGPGYAENNIDTSLEQKDPFYRYGVQADYETRRIYTFARYVDHRFFNGEKEIFDQLAMAVGFAPYLAGFSELNSWVIFKATLSNSFEDDSFMLMLRFFYKNFLWEIGQSFEGHANLNFMVRF